MSKLYLQKLLDDGKLKHGVNTVDGIFIFYSDKEHLKIDKTIYFIYNSKIVATHQIQFEQD